MIKTIKMTLWLALLISIAAVGRTAAGALESPEFLGRWEGLLIVSPAESEIDFSVDLQRGPEGSLAGTLAIPALNVNTSLEKVRAEGATLSFEWRDEKGVRVFTGKLADGVIRGKCVRPNSSIPFELARPAETSKKKAPLEVLEGGAQLQSIFNEDRDQVRLVLLLSPT